MNTGIVRSKWTSKEVKLAKEALKTANGVQKVAASNLLGTINRTHASILIKLCTLAKKHPSLRKTAKRNRIEMEVAPQVVDVTTTETVVAATKTVARIEWANDHLRLYFN